MRKMMEAMEKKGKSPLSEREKDAKLKVLDEMKGLAEDEISERLRGLKKVTVASDSKEGLKEGLEKAHELLEGQQEEEAEHDPSPEEASEMADEESEEESSEDEIEELEKKLAELKAKKMKG